uniref:Uncharacterized protein n=1 Tax=Mustela putorius furo TaxID=9669 RepID=M3YVT1_MUSPF
TENLEDSAYLARDPESAGGRDSGPRCREGKERPGAGWSPECSSSPVGTVAAGLGAETHGQDSLKVKTPSRTWVARAVLLELDS